MLELLETLINLIRRLTFVDYVLYFSVVILIILVVSLIYVIKSENNEKYLYYKKEIDDKKEEEEVSDNVDKEELNLKDVINDINEVAPPVIDMTSYELDQEKKAVISYDELLKLNETKQISYDKEEMIDDTIPIKKIQVDNMELPKMKDDNSYINHEYNLFSYEKEEAFLKALQELNHLLNE